VQVSVLLSRSVSWSIDFNCFSFSALERSLMAAFVELPFGRSVRRQVDTQSPLDDFLFPPPSGPNGVNNSIFTIGSNVDLKWATTLDIFDLMLFQQLLVVSSCGSCINGPYVIAS